MPLFVRGAATLEAAPVDTDVLQLIPAGKGKATHLKKGDKLKIINSQGMQVGCCREINDRPAQGNLAAVHSGFGLLSWLGTAQVVDFWAFSTDAWGEEIMSMHHTRNANQKLNPTVSSVPAVAACKHTKEITALRLHLCVGTVQAGDMLYTASMLPIMKFLEDSGPGQHDTTAAACSYGMYVHHIGEVGKSQSQRFWYCGCHQCGEGHIVIYFQQLLHAK